MALASSVLMFAGSPQAFLGVASAQESLFLLMDILPAYARQLKGELEQTLIVQFADFFTAARALRAISQAGLFPANCRISIRRRRSTPADDPVRHWA
jgi:hypothetical protein